MFGDQKEDYNQGRSSAYALTERTRRHLINVYTRLGFTVLFTAVGSYLASSRMIPEAGMMPMLAGAGALYAVQSVSLGTSLRSGLLYAFGFLEGWGLAPLTNHLLDTDPALLYQAALMSLLVFASFSATALYSRRRTFVAYGGVLMSALLLLSVGGLLKIFFPTRIVMDLLVYIGLLVFAFLVAFHTQLIVERSESERSLPLDSINDSVLLFNNLMGLFVRIMIIMMQQRQREEERRRNNSNKRRQ